MNNKHRRCREKLQVVYQYTCEFQSWEFQTLKKGLFSGFVLRHLVLSPLNFSTSTSELLEKFCARPKKKSWGFFLGPDWEEWQPLKFGSSLLFFSMIKFPLVPAQQDTKKTHRCLLVSIFLTMTSRPPAALLHWEVLPRWQWRDDHN